MMKEYSEVSRAIFSCSVFAVCLLFATIGLPASAAWFDSPATSASVNVGATGTDPHFINISEGKWGETPTALWFLARKCDVLRSYRVFGVTPRLAKDLR